MLSATTFKDAFRRLYGLPVHAWLRQRRMERAAELCGTPPSVFWGGQGTYDEVLRQTGLLGGRRSVQLRRRE